MCCVCMNVVWSLLLCVFLSSVWCVYLCGVVVFSESWRQRRACVFIEAEAEAGSLSITESRQLCPGMKVK